MGSGTAVLAMKEKEGAETVLLWTAEGKVEEGRMGWKDFVKPAKTGMKRKLRSYVRNQKQREQAQGDIQPAPHQGELTMRAEASEAP